MPGLGHVTQNRPIWDLPEGIELEETCEIRRSSGGNFVASTAQDRSHDFSRLRHPCRLIALAAVGHGRKPGGVSLHEEVIERNFGRNITKRLGLGIGDVAGKRDKEAEIERPPGLLPLTAKAMHDAAQTSVPPVGVERQEEMIPGVGRAVFRAAMDEDRPLASGGNLELLDQTRTLNVVWSAFVIIIEANF